LDHISLRSKRFITFKPFKKFKSFNTRSIVLVLVASFVSS